MDESSPSQPANKPAPALESRVRFTLRGMFIATAIVAVCLAAVAPWLRHRTADERKALAKIWSNIAAGAVVAVAAGCATRLREERRAGPARYRLPLSVTRLAGLPAKARPFCYDALPVPPAK